jgi:hypothetical protein
MAMSVLDWEAAVAIVIAAFAMRAEHWHDRPGDLDDTSPGEPWVDPDQADPVLDAAYRGGIQYGRLSERPRVSPIEHALAYADQGQFVFPVHSMVAGGVCSCADPTCTNPGKHPRTIRGFHDASREPCRISEWWQQWPEANLAIATGAPSNIFVVDIDSGKGGLEHLARCARGRPLPDTRTIRSGGGGLHFYFAWPQDIDIRNSTGKLAHGVDVRGNGGYILAPPSNHISGGFYELELNIDPVPAPDWLVAALTEPAKRSRPRPEPPPIHHAGLSGVLRAVHGANEGTRNSLLFWGANRFSEAVGAGLIGEGDARYLLLRAAVDSGLGEREAAATIASAFRVM